jgi:hypothetical protein
VLGERWGHEAALHGSLCGSQMLAHDRFRADRVARGAHFQDWSVLHFLVVQQQRVALGIVPQHRQEPQQPRITATRVRRGARKRVPYENPQGRRYHRRVLYAPTGVQPARDWIGKPRACTAEDLIAFQLQRPPCPVPLVIVLDNASRHRSQTGRATRPRLWARGICFYFLPAYSPELKAIERRFRVIKHDELPDRVYTPFAALEAAVDDASTRYELTRLAQCAIQPGLAA